MIHLEGSRLLPENRRMEIVSATISSADFSGISGPLEANETC